MLVQLKDMAERLPPGVSDTDSIKLPYLPNGVEQNGIQYANSNGDHHSRSDSLNGSYLASQMSVEATIADGVQTTNECQGILMEAMKLIKAINLGDLRIHL